MHQLYEKIVAPGVQNLMEDNHIDRLKIYNQIILLLSLSLHLSNKYTELIRLQDDFEAFMEHLTEDINL